jgi:uncharacterized protein
MAPVLRQPPAIEGYGGGGFRVEGEWTRGSILILDDVARPWPASDLAGLETSDLDAVLAAGREVVEFLLLGTGSATTPPPKAVRLMLEEAGLGLEVMDTASACRLYNVLAKDGRRIAAALIAI